MRDEGLTLYGSGGSDSDEICDKEGVGMEALLFPADCGEELEEAAGSSGVA